MPAEQHVPTEAVPALTAPPGVEATPPPHACASDLRVLDTETVVEDAGQTVNFQVSPNGRLLALDAWPNPLTVIDMASRERWIRQDSTEDYLLFWGDNESVFVQSGKNAVIELWEFRTGRTTPFDTRIEYERPEAWRFTAPYYSGWQAAELLEVPPGALCRAVVEGRLPAKRASDGSLILAGADLARVGGELLRAEHRALLSSEEVRRWRSGASQASFVYSEWYGRAPIRHVTGEHVLILSGRSESPANVLIRVSSEDSWSGLPEVAAQIPINNGGLVRWPEFRPDFFVAENPCPGVKRSEHRFVLYRRTTLSGAEEPLGLLPYPVEVGSSMVWSPDRRHIYIGQRALGRYSVSRLQLPAGD